jgi:hypothetical protein
VSERRDVEINGEPQSPNCVSGDADLAHRFVLTMF